MSNAFVCAQSHNLSKFFKRSLGKNRIINFDIFVIYDLMGKRKAELPVLLLMKQKIDKCSRYYVIRYNMNLMKIFYFLPLKFLLYNSLQF